MPVLSNSKHESVAQALIADAKRDAPAAYRSVYPKCTEAAARSGVSRLLKNANFSARIAELKAEFAAKAVEKGVLSSQEVLQQLSNVGGANLQDFVVSGDDTSDVVQALKDLPPEHAAAIREVEIDTYLEGTGKDARTVKSLKFKLHSKIPALVALGDYYGLFKRKVEHSTPAGKPLEVKDAGDVPLNEIGRRLAFALLGGLADPAKK